MIAARYAERPSFLGENWQRSQQGYSYASAPDIDLLDPVNRTSPNAWLAFLWIFERAKLGDFQELHRLPGLLAGHDDLYLYSAVLDLIAAAGSGQLLSSLRQHFSNKYFDVRLDAYAASSRSYRPEFVAPLLEAWSRHMSTEKGMIQNALSDLLEEGEGPISVAPLKMDFKLLVHGALDIVVSSVPPGSPIFRGRLLSLETIVEPIERLIRGPQVREFSGTLMNLLHRFEAFTGWPRPGLFDEDGNALPLNIRLMLDEFRRQGHPERYQPGQRYFFGHRVM